MNKEINPQELKTKLEALVDSKNPHPNLKSLLEYIDPNAIKAIVEQHIDLIFKENDRNAINFIMERILPTPKPKRFITTKFTNSFDNEEALRKEIMDKTLSGELAMEDAIMIFEILEKNKQVAMDKINEKLSTLEEYLKKESFLPNGLP